MAVAPLAVANHHPNPSLETNANNWSAWPTPTGTATIARQTTGGFRGAACMQVVCDGTVGGQGIGLDLGSSNTPGSTAQWGGSVDLKGAVGGEQVQVWTRHNYSDGTILDGTRTVATLTTSWQRFVAPLMAAPAAGKTINSVTVFVRTGSAVALTFYADGARVTTGTVDQITYCDGSFPGYQWTGTANASTTIRQRTGGPGDIANWFSNPGAEVNSNGVGGYFATPVARATDWSAYGSASFKGGPAAYEATRSHGLVMNEVLPGIMLGEQIRITATVMTDRNISLTVSGRGQCYRNSIAQGAAQNFAEGLGAQVIPAVANVPQRVTITFQVTAAVVPTDFTGIANLGLQAKSSGEAPDGLTVWMDGLVFERDTAVSSPTVNVDGSTPGYGWQGAASNSRTQIVPQRAFTASSALVAGGPNVFTQDVATGGDVAQNSASFFPPNGTTFSYDTSRAKQGNGSIKATLPAGGAARVGIARGGVVGTAAGNLKPGKTYTLSMWGYNPSSNQFTTAMCASVQGTGVVARADSADTFVRDAWVRLSVTFTTTAAGGSMSMYLLNGRSSGQSTAAGDVFWADAWQLEEGSTATPWSLPGVFSMRAAFAATAAAGATSSVQAARTAVTAFTAALGSRVTAVARHVAQAALNAAFGSRVTAAAASTRAFVFTAAAAPSSQAAVSPRARGQLTAAAGATSSTAAAPVMTGTLTARAGAFVTVEAQQKLFTDWTVNITVLPPSLSVTPLPPTLTVTPKEDS